jgi:ABC-type cobalamin transport system ATPase subunit
MLLNHRLIGLGSPEDVFAAPALMDAYGSHLRLLKVNGDTIAVEDTCCDDGTAHA